MDLAAQAVLFDFDGVLVDSTPAVLRHWDALATRHGISPGNTILYAHGRRAVEKIQAFRDKYGLDYDVERELSWFDQLEVDEAADLIVFPGAHKLLGNLGLGRWAIYTACTRSLVTARLEASGLPIPDVVVSGDDVANGKPDPEGYIAAARRLDVDPRSCIVVEDAPAGIIAGRRAGATVVAVATTHPVNELVGADLVVGSLADLAVSDDGAGLTLTAIAEPV